MDSLSALLPSNTPHASDSGSTVTRSLFQPRSADAVTPTIGAMLCALAQATHIVIAIAIDATDRNALCVRRFICSPSAAVIRRRRCTQAESYTRHDRYRSVQATRCVALHLILT